MAQMKLFTKQKQIYRLRDAHMVTRKDRWAKVTIRGFGVDMYTLLYLKWIINKDLQDSTENSAQCYMATQMGGEFGGEWIHVCVSQHCYLAVLQYKIKTEKKKRVKVQQQSEGNPGMMLGNDGNGCFRRGCHGLSASQSVSLFKFNSPQCYQILENPVTLITLARHQLVSQEDQFTHLQ